MSYSREIPCNTHGPDACPMAGQCTDGNVINAAVDLIHATAGKSHKGWGTIKLECNAKAQHIRLNEEVKAKAAAESEAKTE